MSLFAELKRRNVFKVAVAYAVASWLLLQMSDILVPILGLPDNAQKLIFLLLVIGFIPALIFAWAFELTPEGLKKEKDVDRQNSVVSQTGSRLNIAIIGMLVVALAYFVWEARFAEDKTAEKPASVPVAAVPAEAAVSEKSVAVLPFVNMSSDPEQEYFSDGLSEELLNRLAQNDQLRVAARTSSFQFKGQNQDIGEIGRQLKVDNVLEGSVRKSGNRLRITAQLIRVDSGFHLWSQTYEREMDDIFTIQDDIAMAISTALEAELGAAATTTDVKPTDNMEAYQAYLQARFLLNKRGAANMMMAHEQFERATRLDPAFSKAWSGMAFNYALLPSYKADVSTQQAWEIVQASANRALQLDPKNAEAYVALARANIQDDLKTVLGLNEKAYELAPRNPDVVNLYGDFMFTIGDFEAALHLEQEAVDLDPLAAVQYNDMAILMYALGREEEGLSYGRTSANLEPDSAVRTDQLIIGLVLTGQYGQAEQLIKKIEQQTETEDDLINWWWCFLYYQMSDEQKLRSRLEERLEKLDSGPGSFDIVMTAFLVTWLDGTEAALPILKTAYESRVYNLGNPLFFYLPEDISDDLDWLAFWQQPRLAELIDTRRNYKTQERIGLWKERPKQ